MVLQCREGSTRTFEWYRWSLIVYPATRVQSPTRNGTSLRACVCAWDGRRYWYASLNRSHCAFHARLHPLCSTSHLRTGDSHEGVSRAHKP